MKPVKAYQYGKKYILVNDIKEVNIYISPHTGKIYKSRSRYRAHLIEILQMKRRLRRYNAIVAELKAQPTVEDITKFFHTHQLLSIPDSFIRNNTLHNHINPNFTMQIELTNLRYSDNCSNTHRAPHGKPTNWSRDPSLPTGYPGYIGRIHIKIPNCEAPLTGDGIKACRKSSAYFDSKPASAVLSRLGFRTGSGGGGGVVNGMYNLSYECTIFLDDWDGLMESHIIKKLSTA